MVDGEGGGPAPADGGGSRHGLAGARILVAEDSFYIALAIELALQAAGAHVIGPAASLQAAQALAETETPDLAVIDLRLEGELSVLLVKKLRARDIFVVAATGYDLDPALREDLAGVPVIRKPYTTNQLLDALRAAHGSGGQSL